VVLADRFLYTPEVLGRHGRRLPDAFTRPILTAASDGLEPDLVILVDVDPTFARARRKLRKLGELQAKPPSRKGLSGVGLQQRLRRGYLALADEQPGRWVVLENQDSLDKSVKRAVDLIRRAHSEGAARAIASFRGEIGAGTSRAAPVTTPVEGLAAFLRLVEGLSEREPRVAAYMLGGMYGHRVDELRRRLFEREPDAVLSALSGLRDDESFRLRHVARVQHAGLVLRTLGPALASAQGWALWEELAELAPADALSCLSGSSEERAWEARTRWFETQPALRELVVATLTGLDEPRAWQLREELLRARQHELASSYDLSRAVARSVTGLASEQAWRLRRQAKKLAPVAALSSLTGVADDESWQWRRESLRKAPKVVMATLKGRSEDEAWRLRHAVAPDCKEALDGLQGVGSEEAWALREASQDVWPSTVVKTLAILADAPRGEELVIRQLRRYPDNVSLLKHVSSIALGLHRQALESV
jgi:dTMP kinase